MRISSSSLRITTRLESEGGGPTSTERGEAGDLALVMSAGGGMTMGGSTSGVERCESEADDPSLEMGVRGECAE